MNALIERYIHDIKRDDFCFNKMEIGEIESSNNMFEYRYVKNSSLIIEYQKVRNSNTVVLTGVCNINSAKTEDILTYIKPSRLNDLKTILLDDIEDAEESIIRLTNYIEKLKKLI